MSLCVLLTVLVLTCGVNGQQLARQTLLQTVLSEPYSHLQQLGEVTDIPGILVRTFASPAHKQAARLLSRWMTEAGLHSWIDAVGNVHGTIPGVTTDDKQLVIGSHYDTVIDGGRYDGQMGIVAGIAAIKSLILLELEAAGRYDDLATILNTRNNSLVDLMPATAATIQGLAAAAAAVAAKSCQSGASFNADCAGAARLMDGSTDLLDTKLTASLLNSSADSFSQKERTAWLSMVDDVTIPHSIAKTVLKKPVHIVGFADEEGVRFSSTFLGSRALVGTFLKYGALDSKDENGTTLAQVLQQEGHADPAATVSSLAIDPSNIDAYVEVHIEQGPVLEEMQLPLGGVAGIAGQVRLHVSINGEQGHAGTVPMSMRKDPMAAAAQMVSLVEQRCGGGPEGPTAAHALPGIEGKMLVCTVGIVHAFPGASNVIPMQTNFSVDIRTRDNFLRDRVAANLTSAIYDICALRGLRCTVEVPHLANAVMCDEGVTQELMDSIQTAKTLMDDIGIHPPTTRPSTPGAPSVPPPLLVSGAGHDAMAIAEVAKIGMMFVRCRGGVSHSPLEHVEPEDVGAATAALSTFLKKKLT